MKLQFFSDAHVDFRGSRGLPHSVQDADLILVAGDTCDGLLKALAHLRVAYPSPKEIVVVAGNHEFYGGAWVEQVSAGRILASALGIRFLENETTFVGGLRIIGATLWTDYDLCGPLLRNGAMHTARAMMRDHRRIAWQKLPWRRFRPQEACELHLRSRAYISDTLRVAHDGPTLVLSHHAPCKEAIHPEMHDGLIACAYASDLSSIIDDYQPDVWVFGHTHVPVDLRRGRTRLISNPIGYGETPHFDPRFTIEVDA